MKIMDKESTYDDFLIVDESIPILIKSIGVSVYDFGFRNFFNCKSVWQSIDKSVVCRLGAINEYERIYEVFNNQGIKLLHSPEEHKRCSSLPEWYPLIKDLTPDSMCFDTIPSPEEIEKYFCWPVFIKGERQTSRHKKDLSIIKTREQFNKLVEHWKQDAILSWQSMVVREYVSLQFVEERFKEKIQSSYEFRVFVWKQEVVGIGRYWFEGIDYKLSDCEQETVKQIVLETAKRINVPFLVVDVAKTTEDRWIVIEVNDAQESGCAGVSPIVLWQKILNVERKMT